MANIRIDLSHIPLDGETVTFKAPCDASNITGMVIYYSDGSTTTSKEFTLSDANGGDIGVLDNIFAKDAIVKVILDTNTNNAFVQNPDTNTYLENRFETIEESYIHSNKIGVIGGVAPMYTYGIEDIEAGSASSEPEGSLHFVIE